MRLAPLLFALFTTPAAAFPVERCINLGAAMEAPVEGDWGYVIEEDHLTRIADAGFDTVRLPVRFSAHWDGARLSPEILARTDEVIGWAEDAGLNVILDLHHYREMLFDPANHADDLIKIWRALAQHYRDAPETLMFELFNEPEGAFTTARAIPVFARIIEILRQSHPDHWIITGGGDWNSLDEMLLMPPPGYREVRTFHYYDPWEFTHQQAAYLSNPPPPSTWGSVEDRAQLAAAMARAAETAATNGPVFLGEFGVYQATDPDQRLNWIASVRRAAEEQGLPWCYWGFSQGDIPGFSAFTPSTGTWEDGMLDALVP
jgi:endoglucanase